MNKRTYFDTYDSLGWPDEKWLAPYFLTAAGKKKFFASGNDSWGLKAAGVDGTADLPPWKGRIDLDLTIQGHPDIGILLFYHRFGGGQGLRFYSKGDLSRLHQWIMTAHGDRMPIGLFIPFEAAWKAIKEFMDRDGALPSSIEWVAGSDLPAGTFPPP